MSLRNHTIITFVCLLVGFVGMLLPSPPPGQPMPGHYVAVIASFIIGIILGIVLGFRAVITTFSKTKPSKKELPPKEQFRQAFGDDDARLRINDTYPPEK